MKYTIIIPHYNSPVFLEKLLKSIPKDKYIQVIVIDDKSRKADISAIEILKRKFNFEIYHNNGIKGAGPCRNIGLEHAKGKWIIFSDGDDYFLDNFINILKNYFHSSSDVLFFSPTSRYIDKDETADRHFPFQKKINDYLIKKDRQSELNLRYNFIPVWSKIIKKDFLDIYKIRFEEKPNSCGDVLFSTKVGYFMNKFEVSNNEIYCVNKRPGSITTIIDKDLFEARVQDRINRIIFLRKNLSKKDLALIDITLRLWAIQLLFFAIKNFGLKKMFSIIKLYKKNNIGYFSFYYFNPIRLSKYIFNRYDI